MSNLYKTTSGILKFRTMNPVNRPALATQELFEAHSEYDFALLFLSSVTVNKVVVVVVDVFCSVYLRMELELLTRHQEEKSPPHSRKIAGLIWVILKVRTIHELKNKNPNL